MKVANKLQLVGVVTMYNIFVIAAYGNSKLVQVSLLCMSLGIHHHIFSLMLPSICKKFPLKQPPWIANRVATDLAILQLLSPDAGDMAPLVISADPFISDISEISPDIPSRIGLQYL